MNAGWAWPLWPGLPHRAWLRARCLRTASMRSSLCSWALASCLVALAARHAAVVEGFATPFLPLHQADRRQGTSRTTATTTAAGRSMNMFFGGSSGGTMPKLYDGWYKKTQQIQKDIVTGAKSALRWGGHGTQGVLYLPRTVCAALLNMILKHGTKSACASTSV